MDLTTKARVAQLVNPGGTLDPADPDGALFDVLIDQVSAVAERYMDRTVLVGTYTEYFDINPFQRSFWLKAWPVTAITSVNFDPANLFPAGNVLDSTDYVSPILHPMGILEMKWDLYSGADLLPRALKVVYTGGMATGADAAAQTAAFIAAYPDIAGAIDQQVAFQWHNRNNQGMSSLSGEGGGVVLPVMFLGQEVQQLVPLVRSILERHRRPPLAA